MANTLTNIGEEFYTETALAGVTLTVTLVDSANIVLDETTDVGDLTAGTNEPGGASYARLSDTFSLFQNASSNYGITNDSLLQFDVSDSSISVDHGAVIANFQSDVNADGSATDHIIGYGPLSQSRDLSQIDTLEIAAGALDVVVD